MYQAAFTPAAGARAKGGAFLVPFTEFRPVRGPRLMVGAPGLNATSLATVSQVGVTMSKFGLGETLTALDDFRNGSFSVEIGAIGAYSSSRRSALLQSLGDSRFGEGAASTVALPASLTDEQAKAKRPLLFKVLGPVFGALFSEKQRRRARAAAIFKERGVGFRGRARIAWRLKRSRGRSVAGAAAETTAQAARTGVTTAFFTSLKLTVVPVFKGLRFVKRKVAGASGGEPQAAEEGKGEE